MSQIAVFTYLKDSDVPFLGFWSKPKARIFGKPVSKFEEHLQEHLLRQESFSGADGVYVAFVFAWVEQQDKGFSRETDPVIGTVRKNVQGSHWLLRSADARRSPRFAEGPTKDGWAEFLGSLGVGVQEGYRFDLFNLARAYAHARVSALQPAEALLVSVS
jgi:hypothetical protein